MWSSKGSGPAWPIGSGIGFDERAVRPDVVYASLTGYGQEGPYASGRGTTSTTRRSPGRWLPRGAVPTAVPRSWRDVRRLSRWRDARRPVDLRGAGARGETGGRRLDVAAVDGMLSLLSLRLDEHLATGRAAPGRHCCRDAMRVTTCTAARRRLDRRRAPSSRGSGPICAAPRLRAVVDHQRDDAVQDDIRADLARGVRRPGPRRLGRGARASGHVRRAVLDRRGPRRPPPGGAAFVDVDVGAA